MTEIETHKVPASFRARAHIDRDRYLAMYKRSIENPDAFWAEQADAFVTWSRPLEHRLRSGLHQRPLRLVQRRRNSTSATTASTGIWRRAPIRPRSSGRATTPASTRRITYRELHQHVCRLANALKSRGVKKGDRVCIYMPMIPEAAYAMLACARIGAIHSVVFGGFSPHSLKDRILDSDCTSGHHGRRRRARRQARFR